VDGLVLLVRREQLPDPTPPLIALVITSSGRFTVFGCSASTDDPGASVRVLHR